MPEFKLERYVNERIKFKTPISYTKTDFGRKVKICGWQHKLEAFPYDNEFRINGKINLHTSHYNNLGGFYGIDWSDFEQKKILQTSQPDIDRKIINLYNFGSPECIDADYGDDPNRRKLMENHYLTETQKSFRLKYVPQPAKEKNKSCKTFKIIKPPLTPGSKFYDENFIKDTMFLQNVKHRNLYKSYNFCTGMYTDGSAYDDSARQKVCYEIKYE